MGVTINDVAKASNVSKATVSRFLNDRSRVNGKTAETIGRVIQELNYVPNATARNLVLKQANRLGLLVSDVSSPFWNQVCGTIYDHVSHCTEVLEIFILNCDSMVLSNTNKSIQDKLQTLAEQRVAGIILALRELRPEDAEYISRLKIPFVVIQSDSKNERVSSINIDNYKASYEMTQYLLGLGHRNIVYVRGPSDAVYANERFEGFREAMLSKRLYRRDKILQGDNYQPDGYWRTKQILSWNPLPTAVLYGNDAMAYGGMQAIKEAGLRVPEDISLAGFDGLQEQVELFNMLPPLTTVLQPMSLIGQKAAEIILKKIRDNDAGRNKIYNITLPTRFLDRGSCIAVG